MQTDSLALGLDLGLAIILLLAAVSDVKSRLIPNAYPFAIAGLAPLIWLAAAPGQAAPCG
ncbi:MAG: hypothetical protein ACKOXK_02600 [Chakrabartia sp.]